ncbi:MAG: PEGA domain-containing protein [Ignavibacteriaceae bacterium]|jgi:hypothetical protein|nr:PEGA domain-containing protein [Ignavibacteriaceae bacterium]
MKNKIFIIIAFIISYGLISNIFAQIKELDYKPRDEKLNTRNNLPLILVYSPLELTFPDQDRFTGANEVEKKKTESSFEYRLYVKVDEKTVLLNVESKGYEPLRITVTDLVPKRAVVYSIFEKTSRLITDLGEFYLTSVPEGAKITIHGRPDFNERTPYHFSRVTAEPYKILLEKEGYYNIDTIITVVKNKEERLSVKLRAKFGIFKLDTNPANELFIDAVSYKNNDPIQMAEGQHIITVKRKYFKDYIETVEVRGLYDPMVIDRRIKLEPYKGALDINSVPTGATVYLNGKNIGETPLLKEIDAGEYTLEIQKDKYRKEKKSFVIIKDEAFRESIKLKKNGLLNIVGMNSVRITLNGEYKGILPITRSFELPPGDYKIEGDLDGYDSYEQSFYLDAEVKTVEINIIKTEGRFFRFTAFGNERLNQIISRAHLFFSANLQTINPSLLSTAAKYPIYKSVKNDFLIGAGLNFTYLPFLFEADICYDSPIKAEDIEGSEEFTSDPGKEIFRLYIITAKMGFCPFVISERIFPFIGVMVHRASLSVETGGWESELIKHLGGGIQHTEPALFFNIVYRYGDRASITLGYTNFFKNDAFENGLHLYFHF